MPRIDCEMWAMIFLFLMQTAVSMGLSECEHLILIPVNSILYTLILTYISQVKYMEEMQAKYFDVWNKEQGTISAVEGKIAYV